MLRLGNKPLSTPVFLNGNRSTSTVTVELGSTAQYLLSYPQLLPFKIGVIHSYSPSFRTAQIGVSVIMRILRSTTITGRGFRKCQLQNYPTVPQSLNEYRRTML